MTALRNRGAGMVFEWMDSLIGIFIVVLVWILFDNILWDSIEPALVPFGWDVNGQLAGILHTAWIAVPLLYILAWALRIIIVAFIKEPYQG